MAKIFKGNNELKQFPIECRGCSIFINFTCSLSQKCPNFSKSACIFAPVGKYYKPWKTIRKEIFGNIMQILLIHFYFFIIFIIFIFLSLLFFSFISSKQRILFSATLKHDCQWKWQEMTDVESSQVVKCQRRMMGNDLWRINKEELL